MAGDTLTLTCTVTVADWAESSVGTVTLEWMDSEGTTLSTGGDITLGDQMGPSPMFTRTLEFDPLRTSHGGECTCQARSDTGGISLATADVNVTVQSEFISISDESHTLCTMNVYMRPHVGISENGILAL